MEERSGIIPSLVLNDTSFQNILNIINNMTINEISNLKNSTLEEIAKNLNSKKVEGVHNFTEKHFESFKGIVDIISKTLNNSNTSNTSNTSNNSNDSNISKTEIKPDEVEEILNALTKNKNLTSHPNYSSVVSSFKQFKDHVTLTGNQNKNIYVYTTKGIADPVGSSNEELTLEEGDWFANKNNLKIIKEFRFALDDFHINNHTIYIIQQAVGLRCFNLIGLNFESKLIIENQFLTQITYLDHSLYDNDASFIGVLANTNKNNQYMFYEIALTGDSIVNEHTPFINRVWLSTKTRKIDNFVDNVDSYSVMYDGFNHEFIVLIRGVPNLLFVPTYIIKLPDTIISKFESTNYKVHVMFDNDSKEPVYFINNSDDYVYLEKMKLLPFELSCDFNSPGKYEMIVSYLAQCPSIPAESHKYCRFESIQEINYSNANVVAVIILVILLLCLVSVIIYFVLRKLGYIKGAEPKDQNVNPENNNNNHNYNNPKSNDITADNRVEDGKLK